MTEPLLPVPLELRRRGGTLRLEPVARVRIAAVAAVDGRVLRRLREVLRRFGTRLRITDDASSASIVLGLDPALGEPALGREAYRIRIDDVRARLEGGDLAGLFYAVCTFEQWLRAEAREGDAGLAVPAVEIVDRPGFGVRGVMFDTSRNKVPTMGTMYALVDRLASWKINHLQLYFEHAFAYRGHERVWEGWSPFTADEIRALDDYCHERFVELAPNQNSFGHLHRWLVHEPYRALAECPEGIAHPFSEDVEPFSLCPLDPGSFTLLADLYDQLLPCLRSRRFNIGLDETFDLGRGRSAEACAARGRGRVYLDFLLAVDRLVRARDHQTLFWGDIVLEHPELVAELPSGVVALEWGYEAGHPFADHCRRFAESGVEFWVCPGTSSWLSLAGRTENALSNLERAAAQGIAHGASGYLITDWGDCGHLQPLPVSYLGFAAGAHFAWRAGAAERTGAAECEVDWPTTLDRHAFDDPGGALGGTFFDLGNVYLATGAVRSNSSTLFRLLVAGSADLAHRRFDGLSIAALERCRELAAAAVRPGAASERADAELLDREARWVAAALDFSARLGIARLRVGRERSLAEVPAASRRTLADDLGSLTEEAREVWLARNRDGGLAASLVPLERLRAALG